MIIEILLKGKHFNWSDIKNFHIIRYFTRTTKGTCNKLFLMCKCGASNNPYHGANECAFSLKNRDSILKKFDALFDSYDLKKKIIFLIIYMNSSFVLTGFKINYLDNLSNS